MGYTANMKTAISIPDPIFELAEKTARKMKLSRSELYSQALAEFLSKRQPEKITQALDEVYELESSSVDRLLEMMQRSSLPDV
jgi:metal-responsive CopG/Arc/MetJ family transcriptional regulator